MSATSVTYMADKMNPTIADYFEYLIEQGSLKKRQVHKEYQYPALVESKKLWPQIGLFYDYLIRREISCNLKKPATDNRAQDGVDELHTYFKGGLFDRFPDHARCNYCAYDVTNDDQGLQNVLNAKYCDSIILQLPEPIRQLYYLVPNYYIYKDTAKPSLDILENIFKTSMLHFKDDIRPTEFSPELINMDNIYDILTYVKSRFTEDRIMLNPITNNLFFRGVADIVLTDSIVEIKTSKTDYFEFPRESPHFKKAIYQMIFYSLGLYLRCEGQPRKKFIIYNPLLGTEYVLKTPKIDFDMIRWMDYISEVIIMSATSVTYIVDNLNPTIADYFDNIIECGSLEVRQVHEEYEYPALVESKKLWHHIGIFYDYLIRREISCNLKKPATDNRAQFGVNELHRHFKKELSERYPGHAKCHKYSYDVTNDDQGLRNVLKAEYEFSNWMIRKLPEHIRQLYNLCPSYHVYKDPVKHSLDILEDIFKTSMLHVVYFNDDIRPTKFSPELINVDNINDILTYVKSLVLINYQTLLNPIIDNQFFRGDADIVFTDSIFEIKTSKNDYSEFPKESPQFKKAIYQMIFYSLGLYLQCKKRPRKKFIIYNPLLGTEYVLKTPKLNFDLLLWMVEEESNNNTLCTATL
ncbi:hypothetical protein V9T40_006481 [Parthenolecanium corni]|uniref:Uncharacterized protein n=1 Tax=Parthenolecanium corni TaxID=536013 RepID=A0AAN9TK05_9HEMI